MARENDFITALSSSFAIIIFFVISIMILNEFPEQIDLIKSINFIFFITIIIIIIGLVLKIKNFFD